MLARLVPVALAALGLYQIALGVVMLAAPSDFYDAIGPFPPYNAHYTRDAGTFTLALGIPLVVAAWRPSWRVPALAAALAQYVLHAGNHLADIDAAEPGSSAGVVDFVSLTITALVLLALLADSVRKERAP